MKTTKKTISFLFATILCAGSLFAQADIPSAKPGVVYGKTLNADGAISVRALAEKLKADTNYRYTGKVRGEIVEVCKKKGCYIRLKQEGQGDPIMVRFKDYGFFLPQDAIGKTIVLDGQARIRQAAISVIADGVLVVK